VASSRFDKYDPFDGGFRARLAAPILAVDAGKIFAVTINTSGRVVRTGISAAADIRGVICATEAMPLGAAIDVMTDGEIAQATFTVGTAFTSGVIVYAHLDGTVDVTATAGKAVGFTVEVDRLVVRLNPVA
jgi:hypothetical protein